jgi:hypothetical protein
MRDLKELLKKDLKDYKGIPFWSWNDKLDNEELKRQIRQMKESGIGGFFMHARGGLKTEYMGEEWFSATKACIEEAKAQNMNAWCYDENGWPSGFAGMKLLEDSANHVHYITHELKDSFDATALAVYKIENDNIVRIFENSGDVKEYLCIYDKTNSSVVDILNEEVVGKFIDETHKKYYERFKDDFGNAMLGFFTDEPQYYRWDTAYTPVILKAYKDEYNEDVLNTLGALFVDCQQAYELRFKYWRLMNKLFVTAFAKQIYDWCEEHNCKLTGHAVEESGLFLQMWCCAGIMPFYEYEQIPGIDWLGREISTELTPRQVSSVAQQLGKKQVLTETFACTGWDVTPKELKRIAEWQYVNGVNLMAHHLYPYSIRGQRKRDYPTFFSECNPWTVEFKHFNDYFTTLGYMLAESTEPAHVAIIHPMHSAYLTYNREKDYESVKELEDDFRALVEKFGAANILHHYVDELLLEKYGKVCGKKLIMGLCEYDYVVIPKMKGLDSSTANLLKQYIQNGGNIYLEDEKPCFIDGKKAGLEFLKANTIFEAMQNKEFEISHKDTEIRSTYRKSDFGDFLYAVNLSNDKEYSVNFEINKKGARLFDLELREEKPIYYEKGEKGIKIPLIFKPGQSFVIMLDDNSIPGSKAKVNKERVSYDTNMAIVGKTENAFTIDHASISYDNIKFEEKLPIMAISDRLLKERRNGKIFLKYCFDITEIPESIFVETEKMDTSNVWLNGKNVALEKQGRLDKSFVRNDISELVKIGNNEFVFEINYFQSEHINYVLFDCKDATESLMNCLSYDTDIEAIYILGDFNVISKNGFTKGDKNTNIATGDFTITTSKETIDASKIVEQGYPFFAGEMTLEKQINIEDTNCKLQLVGRFALAEVYINDKFVSKLMFDDVCDLSGFANKGRNTLKIKLINSNRNLLGPFHCANDHEPYGVSPNTFDMYGTWVNGKSEQYRDSYSFVKFGVEEIIILGFE